MYESKNNNPETDHLFKAILELKSMEECYRFFDDLCTIREVAAMAQRLEVAKLLRQKVTFNAIAEKTGASTATIARVNKCLVYGADGYQRILDRLDEKTAPGWAD